MNIDWGSIEDRLTEAAEAGMDATMRQMYARARALAPVRKVFAGQGNITSAPATKARWRSQATGRFMSAKDIAGIDVGMVQPKSPPPVRIRRRRLNTEASMARRTIVRQIGQGPSLRETRQGPYGSTVVQTKKGVDYVRDPANAREASEFHLERPAGLTARGRYEMNSGRAWYRAKGSSVVTLGGRLRDSIDIGNTVETGRGMTVSLMAGGREAYYAIYQELGTRHHKAHPFMRPALDEAAKYYPKYVKRALRAVSL